MFDKCEVCFRPFYCLNKHSCTFSMDHAKFWQICRTKSVNFCHESTTVNFKESCNKEQNGAHRGKCTSGRLLVKLIKRDYQILLITYSNHVLKPW